MGRAALLLRRVGGAVAVGLAAGVLVALSLPPFGWWPLAWLGMALVAAALPGRPWTGRLAMGLAWGVGQYGIGIFWVQEFTVPGFVVLVVVCALYNALALLVVPARRWWTVAVALPSAVLAVEWARDRFPLGGFPLGAMGIGQVAGPLSWTLRLGGSLLLAAETTLVGVVLALASAWAWSALRRRSGVGAGLDPPRPRTALVAAAVAVLVPLGAWLSPSGAGGHLPSLTVGLVQGGGRRGTRAIHSDPQVVFNRHLQASAELGRPLDLVVWPEGVLQSHRPFQGGTDAAEVAALARRLSATVVVGVDQDVGATHYRNEVVAWTPGGRVYSVYVKNHLVPFGEYIPYRSLIQRFFNVSDVPYDGIPGRSPAFLATPAAPLGVMISYEVFFDERARSGVRSGGQVLIVPTNTASYRSTQVPTQELAASRMRAIETGRWLVQVSPTGYAAMVAPDGRVVRRSTLDRRTVLEGRVGRATGRTVYVDVGDDPYAAAAVLVLLVVAAAGPARRRRGDRPV